jgi:hypothetical protein
MTPSEELQIKAKNYVDKALASQRAMGHPAKLTPKAYRSAVDRAAASMAPLLAARSDSVK